MAQSPETHRDADSGAAIPADPIQLDGQIVEQVSFAGTGYSSDGIVDLGKTLKHAFGVTDNLLLDFFFMTASVDSIVPEPAQDVTLSAVAAALASDSMKVLTLPVFPELVDLFNEVGRLAQQRGLPGLCVNPDNLIQINPELRPGMANKNPLVMYPQFSPLIQLFLQSKHPEDSKVSSTLEKIANHVYVPSFPNVKYVSLARKLGLSLVGDENNIKARSNRPNDKADFRISAEKYGYRILPGALVQSGEDGKIILTNLRDFYETYKGKKVWLKLNVCSGGNGNRRIEELSVNNINQGMRDIREASEPILQQGIFPQPHTDGREKAFQSGQSFQFILEADASSVAPDAKIIFNGSLSMVVSKDETGNAKYEITNYFEQVSNRHGGNIGSRTNKMSSELTGLVEEQVEKVANYFVNELDLTGVLGLDFIIVDSSEFGPQVYCIESIGRIPLSAFPQIIANRLGSGIMQHQNAWLDKVVTCLADFENIVKDGDYNPLRMHPGVEGYREDLGGLLVIESKTPCCEIDGIVVPVGGYESHFLKLLMLPYTDDPEIAAKRIENMTAYLRSRGIILDPDYSQPK